MATQTTRSRFWGLLPLLKPPKDQLGSELVSETIVVIGICIVGTGAFDLIEQGCESISRSKGSAPNCLSNGRAGGLRRRLCATVSVCAPACVCDGVGSFCLLPFGWRFSCPTGAS